MEQIRSLWHRLGRMKRRHGPRQRSLRQWTKKAGLTDYPLRHYDDEDAARQALRIVDEYTMTSYERAITLWQQVRYLDRAGIPGCLVECGTWHGGASGMMALAHLASEKPVRSLHLFDSFAGLPEPDGERDGDIAIRYADHRASGNLESVGQCVGCLDVNKHLIDEIIKYPPQLTHYHVGWFQDTVPAVAGKIGSVALLRLDGDWYESTKICLEAFYPYVSSGGIVVIDDYGKWPGCRRAIDEFMDGLERPLLLNHIDASGRYIIVP